MAAPFRNWRQVCSPRARNNPKSRNWLAWYIHTESVHISRFWQMISAHSHPL